MPLIWSPGLTVQAHGLLNHSSALLDSLTLGAHASRHLSGGGDALSITNAEVAANAAIAQSKLALTVDPGAHASRHASGGADAITSPLSLGAIPCYRATPSDVDRGGTGILGSFFNTTYTKVAELLLANVTGYIRVKFTMWTASSGTTGYAKIYVNDSPVGAEHSTAGSSPVTFSDNIALPGFGARVQLYEYGSNATNGVYFRDFHVYYDKTQITSEVTQLSV
jgi:hypothetical protein